VVHSFINQHPGGKAVCVTQENWADLESKRGYQQRKPVPEDRAKNSCLNTDKMKVCANTASKRTTGEACNQTSGVNHESTTQRRKHGGKTFCGHVEGEIKRGIRAKTTYRATKIPGLKDEIGGLVETEPPEKKIHQ